MTARYTVSTIQQPTCLLFRQQPSNITRLASNSLHWAALAKNPNRSGSGDLRGCGDRHYVIVVLRESHVERRNRRNCSWRTLSRDSSAILATAANTVSIPLRSWRLSCRAIIKPVCIVFFIRVRRGGQGRRVGQQCKQTS